MLKSSLFYDREAIRALEEEGLIYSTIDEFHYKSAAYGWEFSDLTPARQTNLYMGMLLL